MDHKIFPASLEKLYTMLLWVRKRVAEAGFDRCDLRKIELACEEALVNIIRYAYKEREGSIELFFSITNEKIVISIKDEGPYFNPLLEDLKVDSLASLEERNIGGLGILLMRQYMDEVYYERKKDSNYLTLVKSSGNLL